MLLLNSPAQLLGRLRDRTCPAVHDKARPRPHRLCCSCASAPAASSQCKVERQVDDNIHSWDAEQLEDRRQSHAASSTSDDAASAVSPGVVHQSSSPPALLAPPRLPRASQSAASTAVAAQHLGPPRLSGAAAQNQVFPGAREPAPPDRAWQGSVASRIAVLGRALLALPKGAGAGAVLGGEMLSSKHITQLLSWLGREGRPDVALAAFDWLEERPEYLGDCQLYTRLMSIFARTPRGAGAALGLFERMCAKGIRPDRMAFNCAIGAAGKAGDWGRVQQLHGQMRAAGIKEDVWTFSALFGACQACGNRWQDALALHRDMEAAGIQSNVVVLTTLMNVCQRAGEHERAIRLFRTMEADGLSIDVMAYNQAMASCSWEQAWSCMQAMRLAGVQPSTRSYNALLAACERDGEADRALEAFARMEREAPSTWGYVEPSAVTFNTLVSACGKAGKYDEALQLFAKMTERGLQPDNFTVCSMITAASKADRWRAALHLFRSFCEAGGRPNVVTYNALIKALSQGGQVRRALAAFSEMRGVLPAAGSPGRAPPPAPNLRTWTIVIAACHAAQAWSEVLALHRDMRLAGVEPDSATLQTVISACEKVGAWEQADQIFRTMEERGLLRDMGSLAAATRRMLYALPTAVAGPLMTSGHLALDSGRAARRWVDTAAAAQR